MLIHSIKNIFSPQISIIESKISVCYVIYSGNQRVKSLKKLWKFVIIFH